MKNLLCIGLLGVAFGFNAVPLAQAQEAQDYVLLNGGTNNVAAATTNTYNKTFACSEVEEVQINISFKCSASAVSNATFVLSEKASTLGYETVPKWRFNVPATGTTTVVWTTNIHVPSATSLCYTNLEWPHATAYMTNVNVIVRPKVPKKLVRPG